MGRSVLQAALLATLRQGGTYSCSRTRDKGGRARVKHGLWEKSGNCNGCKQIDMATSRLTAVLREVVKVEFSQ